MQWRTDVEKMLFRETQGERMKSCRVRLLPGSINCVTQRWADRQEQMPSVPSNSALGLSLGSYYSMNQGYSQKTVIFRGNRQNRQKKINMQAVKFGFNQESSCFLFAWLLQNFNWLNFAKKKSQGNCNTHELSWLTQWAIWGNISY